MQITSAALIAAAIALVPATGAAASPGDVQVSFDGTSYSTGLAEPLFDDINSVVPGDSQVETFYLRNSGTEPGHLRITLRDVVVSDADVGNALTVSTSTVGQAGLPAAVSRADPCAVLHEGQLLAPGEVVRVTTTLALGDLDGVAGQNALASLSLGITLTSAALQLPPTDCGRVQAVVPVVPSVSNPGARGEAGNRGIADGPPTVAAVEGPAVAPDLPVLNLPGLLGIDPNTWRLFEEYLVFLLVGAFVVGTAWFSLVAWRRRNNGTVDDKEAGAAE